MDNDSGVHVSAWEVHEVTKLQLIVRRNYISLVPYGFDRDIADQSKFGTVIL